MTDRPPRRCLRLVTNASNPEGVQRHCIRFVGASKRPAVATVKRRSLGLGKTNGEANPSHLSPFLMREGSQPRVPATA